MERIKGDPSNSLSYRNDSSLSLPNHAGVFVIRTPTSKANFFDLKDFEEQVRVAVTAWLQYRLSMMQRYNEFILSQKQVAYARAVKGFLSLEFKAFLLE
jgi:hypothetical protein